MRAMITIMCLMASTQTSNAQDIHLRCAVTGETITYNLERLTTKREPVSKNHNLTIELGDDLAALINTDSGGDFFYQSECKLSPKNINCRAKTETREATFSLSRITGTGKYMEDWVPLKLMLVQNNFEYQCEKATQKKIF